MSEVASVEPAQIREFWEFSHDLAAQARSFILSQMRSGFDIETKSDKSVVTAVDRDTERLLRVAITERYPHHGIVGEELESHNPNADYRWVLDPIDGTLNFCHGIPTFGSILGLFYRNRPLVGVIDHPIIGLRYSAALGQGAYCNGDRLRILDCDDPTDEIVAINCRTNFSSTNEEAVFDSFVQVHPSLRIYYDCFAHSLAAGGGLTMVAFNVFPWDLAASQILVEEAGGTFLALPSVTGVDGRQYLRAVLGKPRAVELLVTALGSFGVSTR